MCRAAFLLLESTAGLPDFLGTKYKKNKIYQSTTKYTKIPQKIPKCHKVHQTTKNIPNCHKMSPKTTKYNKTPLNKYTKTPQNKYTKTPQNKCTKPPQNIPKHR
jgi:hypothetical protein